MPKFDTPINTNDQSLDRVLANLLPILLMFTSGPIDPALQTELNDVARTEAGKLLIAKINTQENPTAAKRFNAGTTLVAWKDGIEQLRLDYPTPAQVREAANNLLGRGPKPRIAERKDGANQQAADHPITVNQANFDQEVLHSNQPVLVDFWAAWCGPCRMIAPTLEKFAHEYAGRLKIAKLNVDENPQLAAQYRAHSIPLLVMFKGGKPVNQLLGAHPEPNIRNLVEQTLRTTVT
jgi:thioredoxin 1